MTTRMEVAWKDWDNTHRQINAAFAGNAPDGYVNKVVVDFFFLEADYPEYRQEYANWLVDMSIESSFIDVGGLPVPVYLANRAWMTELQIEIDAGTVSYDDPCPSPTYNFTPGLTPITTCY
jgi:hypothetical protein